MTATRSRGPGSGTARNVEIKARLADPEATRRLVAAAAHGPPTSLAQTDTFYRTPRGRLKLREIAGADAQLIWYERPDTPDPAESAFTVLRVADGPALRELLGAALGRRAQVVKRRQVYLVGRTRVHLDEVEGLGGFLELEVQLADGEPAEAGAREARELMRRLGIGAGSLVAEAYVDLLERRGPAATR